VRIACSALRFSRCTSRDAKVDERAVLLGPYTSRSKAEPLPWSPVAPRHGDLDGAHPVERHDAHERLSTAVEWRDDARLDHARVLHAVVDGTVVEHEDRW
jgi:hypothetical protein